MSVSEGACREAAELLVVGVPGPELDAASERILAATRPGGVILFGWNVVHEAQLRELVSDLRRVLPGVVLYADAEGGRVDRLRSVVGPAPAGAALAAAPASLAGQAGRWVGESLAAFGFDADLAPVVDLDHGAVSNALDERYLGNQPGAIAERARAFLEGLHAAGIGGCLKHFPGLGRAGQDTHDEGTVIRASREELEGDLAPFRDLLAGDAPSRARAVLVSHAAYPALDPRCRPASLSPPVATELLRHELGFEGVLMSDDLDMGALAPWGDLAQRSATALEAGCDLLFACRSLAAAPGIVSALAQPQLRRRRDQARERVAAYRRYLQGLRDGYPGPADRPTLATIRRRLAELSAAAT